MSKELKELIKQLEKNHDTVKASAAGGFKDERVLSIPLGKTIVRILPPVPGSGIAEPWVRKYHHTFHSQATGQLVTLDCPTSFGMNCALCDNNTKLWADKSEASQELARKFKRKVGFAANVYVKESKESGEEGNVKVYSYGVKVMDIIKKGMEIQGIVYMPTVDGADFVIYKEMKNVGGGVEFPNYDSSQFIHGKALAGTDDKIMSIIQQGYDLKEFEADIPDSDKNLAKAFKRHVLGDTSPEPEPEKVEEKAPIINMREKIEKSDDDIPVVEDPVIEEEDEIDEKALLAELEASMKDDE